MQKLIYTAALCLLNIFQTYAQANLGPGDENRQDFYIHVSYLKAIGNFGKDPESHTIYNDEEVIKSILEGDGSGSGAKSGFGFGIGQYFDLMGASESKFRIGMNVDYINFQVIFCSWENTQSVIMQAADYSPYFNLSLRLGPSLQMNLSDKTRINFHYQLSPTFSAGPHWTYDGGYDAGGFSMGEAQMDSKGGFGLKHLVGGYLAFTKLRVGIDLDLGTIKFKSVNYNYSYYDNNGYNYQYYEADTEAKAANSTLNISLGVIF